MSKIGLARIARARKARSENAPDFDEPVKTVEDVAAVSAGLWLSYLFGLFYIGIAAGGVTHRDLLLDNPVKLPFLNVELPLVGFFILAPLLFIISHAYTLTHFVLLAGKIGHLNAAFSARLPNSEDIQDDLRERLPSNIFVQFLAGPSNVRDGGLGRLLQAISWISLVFGPIALLLFIQLQFLPYHLEWVTWLQRFAILGDVILLCVLWPAVLETRSTISWRAFWRSLRRYGWAVCTGLIVAAFAFTVATFPGEGLQHVSRGMRIPTNTLTTWLFNGEVDQVTRRRSSWLSNTLVLPGFDASMPARMDDRQPFSRDRPVLVLRGRHLEGAVFNSANLRNVDLTGAYLQGASLDGAQLQVATLDEAQLQGASFDDADLEGASLNQAKLQGASLQDAQLQGAFLQGAELQGAFVRNANLEATSFRDAQAQGADLEFARLQGATLFHAQLQGASLDNAEFDGTSLNQACVWRTILGESIRNITSKNLIWDRRFCSQVTYNELKSTIERTVPSEDLRQNAIQRIASLDHPDADFQWSAFVSQWQKTIDENSAVDAYANAVAKDLGSIICSGGPNASFILRGLLEAFNNRLDDRLFAMREHIEDLIQPILDPKAAEHCSGIPFLTRSDLASLARLAEWNAIPK